MMIAFGVLPATAAFLVASTSIVSAGDVHAEGAEEALANVSKVLGPAKPSDIVTVSTFFENPCPGSPTTEQSRVFNRLEGSDGIAHPFAIPAGKVLVITSADLSVTAGAPPTNHLVQLRLSKNTVTDANIVNTYLISDSTGSASWHYDSPTGTVVKSGVNVCLSGRDVTTTAPAFAVGGILFGYLADDR